MGRWGDGEMGRWGDGEMGRWGDGEMGRWGDGETEREGTLGCLCGVLSGDKISEGGGALLGKGTRRECLALVLLPLTLKLQH